MLASLNAYFAITTRSNIFIDFSFEILNKLIYILQAVKCDIDRNASVGNLSCNICDANFQTSIHALTEPIDIFAAWLDETNERQQRVSAELARRNKEAKESM